MRWPKRVIQRMSSLGRSSCEGMDDWQPAKDARSSDALLYMTNPAAARKTGPHFAGFLEKKGKKSWIGQFLARAPRLRPTTGGEMCKWGGPRLYRV